MTLFHGGPNEVPSASNASTLVAALAADVVVALTQPAAGAPESGTAEAAEKEINNFVRGFAAALRVGD